MTPAAQLLQAKGNDIWSIGPEASVYEAIHLLAEKEIGALMVFDDAQLVGVISERDYARQVILKGRSSANTRVREIMTTRVVYAEPRSERRCVLICRGCGNHSSAADVVIAADVVQRISAVHVAANHTVANDHLHASPGMV